MKYFEFNINYAVKVKLTERGFQIHEKYYKELRKEYFRLEYLKPEVDEDGYSKFQMWTLMDIFGSHIHIGSGIERLPFDTNILISKEGF